MYRYITLSLLVLFGLSGCDNGDKLIVAHIECDGEHVLQSQFAVAADAPAAEAWKLMAVQNFKSIRKIERLPNDPKRGVVKGRIRILLLHADAIIASADVDRLQVVQVPGADVYWTIPADEVERIAKAAGY